MHLPFFCARNTSGADILVPLLAAACGTSRQFSEYDDPISMSGEEARIVDDLTERGNRARDEQGRCDFAKSTEARLGAEMAGARKFVAKYREIHCLNAQSQAKAAAARSEKTATWKALVAQEASSGTCDAGHKEALESLLLRLKTNLAVRLDDGSAHILSMLDYQIAAVSNTPSPFHFTAPLASELHVFLVSQYPSTLDARMRGEPATLPSPWEKRVHSRATLTGWTETDDTMLVVKHPVLGEPPPCDGNELHCLPKVSSRVLLPHGSDPVSISVSGKGCVLVAVFRAL